MVLVYRPMKLPAVLLSTLLLAPTVALAEHTYDPGGSSSRKCFKSEYKEEYIPGTEDNPGYVRSSKETVEVPCDPNDDVAEMGGGSNVTFNINTIDATGVEDVLTQQQGNIIGMIRSAANEYGDTFLENVDTSIYNEPFAGYRRA